MKNIFKWLIKRDFSHMAVIFLTLSMVFFGAPALEKVFKQKPKPPVKVEEKYINSNISTVSIGYWHMLGMDADGKVFNLGFSKSENKIKFQSELNNTYNNVKKIVSGSSYNIFLRNDGTLAVEVFDESTKLIKGKRFLNYDYKPVIEINTDVLDIESNSSHIILLKNDGTVMGYETAVGEFMYGVEGLEKVAKIAAAERFGVVLKKDGSVWVWKNDFDLRMKDHQLPLVKPIKLEKLPEIIDIKAGKNHLLMLSKDKKVFAYGNNGNGQLGDGTTIKRELPVKIPEIDNIDAIGAGNEHSVAVRADGAIITWGANYYGQLGDKGMGARANPMEVAKISGFKGLTVGYNTNFIFTQDGKLFTWGSNRYSKYGDNSVDVLRTLFKVDSTVKYKEEINKKTQDVNKKKQNNIKVPQSSDTIPISKFNPNSDMSKMQWAIKNSGQFVRGRQGVVGIDLNMQNAWNITKGSEDVVVGILDGGVDITNREISQSVYVNTGEIPGNFIDDDKNGYIDDVYGWDFINDDNTINDKDMEESHGTMIAGVISANHDGKGIMGIAPNVKIMPLKITGQEEADINDFIRAVDYTALRRVNILNCSLGFIKKTEPFALSIDQNRNLLFIAAAGNYADEAKILYPAGFPYDNIISVASIDNKGNFDEQSNSGEYVDVVAPGKDILNIFPQNRYAFASGTSYACAYVTGAAALFKSYKPEMTSVKIANTLLNNTVFSDKLKGKVVTSGRVDIYKLLTSK